MEPTTKRLFSYDDVNGGAVESGHAALSPYLFDAAGLADRHLVVRETVHPLSTATPKMLFGNMPNDGGHLLLSPEERSEIIRKEPGLAKLIRPLIGARDLINGEERYCFWLVDVGPGVIRASQSLTARLKEVRSYRAASKRAATRALSATPALFGEIRHTGRPSVIIPRHSSERREYVPIIYDDGNSIAHDSCMFVPDASLFDFAVLTSAMHMTWLRHIGGRLESRYRYSAGLVLNTFPWPSASAQERARIESLAQTILNVRASFVSSTLADLYDPDVMPPDLRKAHRALDAAVGSLYRSAPFKSDRERVEHLFGLYEKLVSPLIAATKPNRGKRRLPSSA